MEAIRTALALRYQDLLEKARAAALKEEIARLYQQVQWPTLQEAFQAFLQQEKPTRQAYRMLRKALLQARKHRQKAALQAEKHQKLARHIFEHLRSLGYRLVAEDFLEFFLRGEKVRLQAPFGSEYWVEVQMQGDELKVEFVREIEEGALNDYERQKDLQLARQWCRSYEQVLSFLREQGILLETKVRIEPEEQFRYIFTSARSAASRQEAAPWPQTRRKGS